MAGLDWVNDRESLIDLDIVKLWELDTRRCRHDPSSCSIGYGKSSILGGTRDDKSTKELYFQ